MATPQPSLEGRIPPLVLFKLIFFALAIAIVPVASYFLSVDRFFSGNTTYAGAFAGLVANVILGAYVVVAFLEEDPNAPKSIPKETTGKASSTESKKEK